MSSLGSRRGRCLPLLLLVAAATTTTHASFSSSSSAASCRTAPSLLSSGLQNLGNTCYLNAQLQCAFHIPVVRHLIVHAASAEETPEDDDDDKEEATPQPLSPALQALQSLFVDMEQQGSHTQNERLAAVAPRHFCAVLGIPVMQQQDSQEFWKLLLPALQLPRLTDLYQGAYEDYIMALDGSGRERRREEAFLDLSLDVTTTGNGGSAASVASSLQQLFGEPELLSEAEGNGWRPEKGADKVDAHKGTLLRSQGLPSILQLHLKRFQFDWMTEKTSKINAPFSFPAVLDLSTVCEDTAVDGGDAKRLDDDDRVMYDLQAVIVHAGEYGSGHYYAYVRPNIEQEDWYRFNDHIVEKVELKDVLMDAYGGRIDLGQDTTSNTGGGGGGGILARILRVFQPAGGRPSYGFGGRTSNAYVLQYVRRSELSLLYPSGNE